MTRVRYKKTDDPNVLIVTKPIVTPTAIYHVSIVVDKLQAVISSQPSGIVEGVIGSHKGLNHLKKEVKLALKRLGVNFQNEVRPGRALVAYQEYADEVMDDLIHDQ